MGIKKKIYKINKKDKLSCMLAQNKRLDMLIYVKNIFKK